MASLLLGLVLVNLLEPGSNLNLPLPEAGASANVRASSLSLKDFVAHLVPTSAFDAMARNEILQIVVFSLLFGAAAAALGAPMQIANGGLREGVLLSDSGRAQVA